MSISNSDYSFIGNKAKEKKDGVYTARSYTYVVKDRNLIAFSDYYGYCYRAIGIFVTPIGKIENRYDIRKELTKFLKEQ